jgi:hypothetical protein
MNVAVERSPEAILVIAHRMIEFAAVAGWKSSDVAFPMLMSDFRVADSVEKWKQVFHAFCVHRSMLADFEGVDQKTFEKIHELVKMSLSKHLMGNAFYIDLQISLENFLGEVRDRQLPQKHYTALYNIYVGQWFLKETRFNEKADSQIDYLIGGSLCLLADDVIREVGILLNGGSEVSTLKCASLLDGNISEIEQNFVDAMSLAVSKRVIEKYEGNESA